MGRLSAYRPSGVLDCFNVEDLQLLAQRRLPRCIYDFYAGGAEAEHTLTQNRLAFSAWHFAPHVLQDVRHISLQANLLDAPAMLPMAIAPTGGAGYGYRHADVALARAAAQHGIPYTLSSSATTTIEAIATQAPGRHWFQAYIFKNQEFFWSLLKRAEAADFEALMITLDLPVGGKRERDMRNHFSMPFRYTARNVLDFARCPRWASDMLWRGLPVLENLRDLENIKTSPTALASSVGKAYDAGFDWSRMSEVRDRWPRKLLVKGVHRQEDAERLVALGCDALVVSNHGGRQLDGTRASLHVLPEILRGAAGMVPVLMDGGIRRGTDVAKALALGAQGVLLGRATLFGALAGGQVGAVRALDILKDELHRTLQLCGVPDVRQLKPDILRCNWPQDAVAERARAL
jgi:(S)-mandelate dehydrogenase